MLTLVGGVTVMGRRSRILIGKPEVNGSNEICQNKTVWLLIKRENGEIKFVANEKQDLFVKLTLGLVIWADPRPKETYHGHVTGGGKSTNKKIDKTMTHTIVIGIHVDIPELKAQKEDFSLACSLEILFCWQSLKTLYLLVFE